MRPSPSRVLGRRTQPPRRDASPWITPDRPSRAWTDSWRSRVSAGFATVADRCRPYCDGELMALYAWDYRRPVKRGPRLSRLANDGSAAHHSAFLHSSPTRMHSSSTRQRLDAAQSASEVATHSALPNEQRPSNPQDVDAARQSSFEVATQPSPTSVHLPKLVQPVFARQSMAPVELADSEGEPLGGGAPGSLCSLSGDPQPTKQRMNSQSVQCMPLPI
jgi:hypothetical protein